MINLCYKSNTIVTNHFELLQNKKNNKPVWWMVQSNKTGIYNQYLVVIIFVELVWTFGNLDGATNSILFIFAVGLLMHNMAQFP